MTAFPPVNPVSLSSWSDAPPTAIAVSSAAPSILHLVLLVFEAVMEVVCVSLPGYIIARIGMFDAENQKFLANLNVMLFTPCLVFTKLASQLSPAKFSGLAIIPVIFVIQTAISFLCGRLIARCFRFKKRQTNFVVAMAVFGNSNSLPMSLVLSLAKTLDGLHWDRIPNDSDSDVAARGILYLLIFQQLGQLLRWSWGYRVLLAPREPLEPDHAALLEGDRYRDEERSATIGYEGNEGSEGNEEDDAPSSDFQFPSNDATPVYSRQPSYVKLPHVDATHGPPPHSAPVTSDLPRFIDRHSFPSKRPWYAFLSDSYSTLPLPIQRFFHGVWEFMNPPLWSMLFAIIVASVPALQSLFFSPGSLVNNSVTNAIDQSGRVAVPLILVVLGANLARNTLPAESLTTNEYAHPREERDLIIASLLGRMLLPTLMMGPILAGIAKYVPVSILDDPIFVIVCFLLTGAPSALQLAQICQLNNVYMGAMARLLFQSYVVWILPSTLVLVVSALEVVRWATA